MSKLIAADALSVGDTIDRRGTVRIVKAVRTDTASGNVEVDYRDGSIEDLDPSSYSRVVVGRRWYAAHYGEDAALHLYGPA